MGRKNNYNISIIEMIFQNNKTEALLFVTLYTSIVKYIKRIITIRLDSSNSYISNDIILIIIQNNSF